MLRKFTKHVGGNVALSAALISPILFGSAALGVDYALYFNKAKQLQYAADSAALAAVKELALSGSNEKQIRAVAKNYAVSKFAHSASEQSSMGSMKVQTVIGQTRKDIVVDISYTWAPFFAHMFDSKLLPIKVNAKAILASEDSFCTVALNTSGASSLALTGKSSIRARGCAVQANSSDAAAVVVPTGSKLETSTTCVAGGYKGPSASYLPQPLTDCPPIADPLAGRSFPSDKSCKYKETLIVGESVKLNPGVYCGGVYVTGQATVTLRPGVYTFLDGIFDVGGGSKLIGDRVNLHFEKDARLFFRNDSQLDLSAPVSGSMAGLLVSATPSNTSSEPFEIQSNNAKKFTGLIYTPNNQFKIGDDVNGDGVCDPENDPPPPAFVNKKIQQLQYAASKGNGNKTGIEKQLARLLGTDTGSGSTINCTADVGQYSDWTAIVARDVIVTSGVELILNSDYKNSEVPVPDNNGFLGTSTRLVQ